MTRDEVNENYLNWMYDLVCDVRYFREYSYKLLIEHLHHIDFYYTIPMDENRAEDGMALRYRFGYENGIDQRVIASYLDDRPCSVLEMMIALSLRCEEDIMSDLDLGNRTGLWFWVMLENLGLSLMIDSMIDYDYVDQVIERLLERKYGRDGKGGLFTVYGTKKDMRTIEIWYQMCLYLDDLP